MNLTEMKAKNRRLMIEYDKIENLLKRTKDDYKYDELVDRQNRIFNQATALFVKIQKIDPDYDGN